VFKINGGLWPYSQILDYAGRLARDKYSSLFDWNVGDEEKSFITLTAQCHINFFMVVSYE